MGKLHLETRPGYTGFGMDAAITLIIFLQLCDIRKEAGLVNTKHDLQNQIPYHLHYENHTLYLNLYLYVCIYI